MLTKYVFQLELEDKWRNGKFGFPKLGKFGTFPEKLENIIYQDPSFDLVSSF